MKENVTVEIPLGFPVRRSQVEFRIADGRLIVQVAKYICDACRHPFMPWRQDATVCDHKCRSRKHRRKPMEGN